MANCERGDHGSIRCSLAMERRIDGTRLGLERFGMRLRLILNSIWLPRVFISFGVAMSLAMIAFLLRFTPLYPVAEILAWPGYIVCSVSPIQDTPGNVLERILDVGIALILPVYWLLILICWFLKDRFLGKSKSIW